MRQKDTSCSEQSVSEGGISSGAVVPLIIVTKENLE